MLSNNQKSVLKYLYPTKTINENDFEIKFKAYPKDKTFSKLFSDKYLHRDTSKLYAPAVISLTEKGRAYVEELITERKRYQEEKHRSWIQFWIPLIISNVISLAALVVAILAYIKQ